MNNLEFVDAQEMHQNHPDTFDAPTYNQLGQIYEGVFIKVSIGNERFWAQVTKVENNNNITAIVDNDLVRSHIHGIKYKDEIHVEKRHIIDIIQ